VAETEMTQGEMFDASFKRPSDYFQLTEAHQWAIDQRLGILDWRGDDLTEAQLDRFRSHYKTGAK
jgi:hypothetical protein